MIAEAVAAPGLEAADLDMPDPGEPRPRHEDVIDMIGGPVLVPVAPVMGRLALGARRLTAELVIGADQPAGSEPRHRMGMVHPPPRPVPDDVVVEIPGDHAGPARKE